MGCFALFFSEKRGQNIKVCEMNATRRNKRKPFLKCLAQVLVCVDMVQVIKAQVHSVSLNPEFFPYLFSLSLLFFYFFLLTRKTYCQFKPLNNASQVRWFCLVAFIVHASMFCPHFSQKQSAKRPKENTLRGMFYYLIENSHAKIQTLLKKKEISPEKVTYVSLAPGHSILQDI